MVKQLGKGKARSPTKKEKLLRIQEAQESQRLAKYIYPAGLGLLASLFLGLYGFLYYKANF